MIDETLKESFPASDPPAYWSGADTPARAGLPEAVRKTDGPGLDRAGEESEPTEGPAPTG